MGAPIAGTPDDEVPLVDSAGLVVIALLKTDEPTGPDTVFGTSVTDVEPYLLLGAGGVGLLAASWTWRKLRPRDPTRLEAEGERAGQPPGPGGIGPVGG